MSVERHTQQRPFKCPICNGSRFDSPDALNRHLIINHNDIVMDSDTDDFTLYDENEELNLGKVKDVYVKREVSKDEAVIFMKGKDNKDEIIPLSNTAKLSYRDVLVKGRANETKDLEDLLIDGMDVIPSSPESQVVYDLKMKIMMLPDAPQEVLSEAKQENLIFETLREVYKDTKAGEYFEKAFEMLERGF
ncbi:12206_t:CDS:2 [Funneliformis caledonium]|uniref:12206_t:CDS:1 n=1 Tax=Funneliformis caledonium TaxID=1117310 RepID=A0A9N9EYV1_9GLOM|nr:12206_t:CDS:2 [Funneliformis caledonium]